MVGELMQIEKSDFEKLMKEAKEAEETILDMQNDIERLEIDKKHLEDDVRELNFDNEKLADELKLCQKKCSDTSVIKPVEIKEIEYTIKEDKSKQMWKINGLRVDSNGLRVGNYNKV